MLILNTLIFFEKSTYTVKNGIILMYKWILKALFQRV
jgi:hypothetical protein